VTRDKRYLLNSFCPNQPPRRHVTILF